MRASDFGAVALVSSTRLASLSTWSRSRGLASKADRSRLFQPDDSVAVPVTEPAKAFRVLV
jgi:hypothetical protein